jgi:RimJ/RimL family protein N-acetyltransferase
VGDLEPDIQGRRAEAADVRALRRFRCDQGGWFARDVQRLVRGRVASAVAAGEQVEVLLFERAGELAAVAVLEIDQSNPSTCDLHIIAIANDHQGSDVETSSGQQPLVKVVLDTALALARELGASRVQSIVARGNSRSIRMLAREGFARVGSFDSDYDEYAARLA